MPRFLSDTVRLRSRRTLAFLTCAVALLFLPRADAALRVYDLRCDNAVAPLGIDSAAPRLSWKLESPERGARQTAWQVQVGSSREALLGGNADMWDSGRIEGGEQFQIMYRGPRLTTAQQVFWRVRVWDETDGISAWTAPASWTMGVTRPEDWSASWITDPSLLEKTRSRLGFSTPPVTDPETQQWIQLDLGRTVPIEKVTLHALVHTVSERLGFPRWFKVELAGAADFHDAITLADHTRDPINEWLTRVSLPGSATNTRYVRLTATRLRMMSEDGGARLLGRLALSQIEVFSGGKNVAVGAAVSSSASLEEGPWSAAAVVDGLAVAGANPRACGTLLLRREFAVRQGLRRATLFVCGLGHYTLSANGAPVAADDLLTPGWTEYAKTCLYDTRDLTAQLRAGSNVLALTLASGMYNVPNWPGRYTKFVGPPRPLAAIAQLRLEYADGRVENVVTDTAWKATPGPITFAQVYGGEDYDAAAQPVGWDQPGFDDARWTPAVTIAGPGGALKGASEAGPHLRAHETLPPVSVRELRPGTKVYDLGQNTALMPRLRVRGARGAAVKITPAELVHPDGSLDTASVHAGKTEASWNYRLAGDGATETWMPSFFYHGARYLQVEAVPAPGASERPEIVGLEGVVVHAGAAPAGGFRCSSELFNRIRLLVRWAQRSNLSHVLTDCPHRERLGWLEQYHLNGPSLRYEFDLTRLYTKTFGDMADAQRPNGLVPSIAPEYIRFDGDFRDSPEWGSALILAAWQQYVWTGDTTSLERFFPAMQRYFGYLQSRAHGNILSHGLGDWYDLGPNRPGLTQLTPVALPATAIFYEDALRLRDIARVLGKSDEARRYDQAASEIRAAFQTRFYDDAKRSFSTGSQTANAMPLVLGLAPEERRADVLAALLRDVEAHHNGVTAGDVGYRYLLRALAANERSDVIFAMNNQSERPGYGYQLAHGATSLPESWDANRLSSQNHFMLGQIMEWFYGDVAGIAPDPTAPGYGRVIVSPNPVGDLTWAEARYESVRGPVAVRWDRQGQHVKLAVTIPPNATASVRLPGVGDGDVKEGGRSVAARTDVKDLGVQSGRRTLEVGSGAYTFEW